VKKIFKVARLQGCKLGKANSKKPMQWRRIAAVSSLTRSQGAMLTMRRYGAMRKEHSLCQPCKFK